MHPYLSQLSVSVSHIPVRRFGVRVSWLWSQLKLGRGVGDWKWGITTYHTVIFQMRARGVTMRGVLLWIWLLLLQDDVRGVSVGKVSFVFTVIMGNAVPYTLFIKPFEEYSIICLWWPLSFQSSTAFERVRAVRREARAPRMEFVSARAPGEALTALTVSTLPELCDVTTATTQHTCYSISISSSDPLYCNL